MPASQPIPSPAHIPPTVQLSFRNLAETLDDNGKMLYLTLEKAPQLAGLGPWMGVIVGEKQVDSDYPEEKKARISKKLLAPMVSKYWYQNKPLTGAMEYRRYLWLA